MSEVDKQYRKVIKKVLENGSLVQTRNSEVLRVIGARMYFEEFPLVSLRNTAWNLANREMEWFLSGSNRLQDLHESVRHWWAPFSKDGETLPYNYGVAFRNLNGIDQVKEIVEGIKNHPNSRRNIITTWIPEHVYSGEMNPTNCHGSLIQFFVEKETLHLEMIQRSCDMILGVPHNLSQYWCFLNWIGSLTGYSDFSMTWYGTDIHIYKDHIPVAEKIANHTDPKLVIKPKLLYNPKDKNEFNADDFKVYGYKPILLDKPKMIA